MGNPRVAILGSSGMLGAMTLDVLSAEPNVEVIAAVRDDRAMHRGKELYPTVEWRRLDAQTAEVPAIAAAIRGAAWIINCIGIIKPYIHDDRAEEVERAIRVNALFPHLLGRAAAQAGARVLQIATDCVYSGRSGRYAEDAEHDALDVYGKSKSLGEAHLASLHLLRCSIIGPEAKGRVSLLEWFLGQPRGAEVNGFTNHRWNGITTLHFARLCLGVIAGQLPLPRLHHLVPEDALSKSEMLAAFRTIYGREDIRVTPTATATAVDRTLATNDAVLNARLWNAAGYATPPTIRQMIEELRSRSYRFVEART